MSKIIKNRGSIVFSTERIHATEIVMDDYDDLYCHWKLFPPTSDFSSWSEAQLKGLVADMASDREEGTRNSYRLIVRHKADSSFMGYINAWKITPHHFLPNLGIALHPHFHKEGYGTEIYRGLIGFAFRAFGDDACLQAEINPANIPSIKMHFNCGMSPFCFTKDGYKEDNIVEDELSMRISRAHFENYGAYPAKLSL